MRALPLRFACPAVALAAFSAILAIPSGPTRQIAGLSLFGAFAGALFLARSRRLDAVVPAVGLALTFLILAGLALATFRALTPMPAALALTLGTLAAGYLGTVSPARQPTERNARPEPSRPSGPLILTGALVFAVVAVVAVRYSATSAAADSNAASSVALWAYPAGGQLHVGVQQGAGSGGASLRIVVTQDRATLATWSGIRLAPGQSWQAPALTVAGDGPARVVALRGAAVVASLSSR